MTDKSFRKFFDICKQWCDDQCDDAEADYNYHFEVVITISSGTQYTADLIEFIDYNAEELQEQGKLECLGWNC